MSGPFIFVSSYKLKEGQLENYKQWTEGLIRYVEANEPRMVAFNLYLNDAGTEVTSVQFTPTQARWSSACRSSASTSTPPTGSS